jgi:hypothetical protein
VKRRLAPKRNAPIHDLVMTPPALARQIVEYYAPRGRLLDPCRGEGAFYNAMQRFSNDVHWCELDEGVDFYAWREPVDWIITNPPWSKFRGILQHSMSIATNIVFLATFTHFVTKARLRDIARAGFAIDRDRLLMVEQPPPPWPPSGFQPTAVLIRKGARSLFDVLPTSLPLFDGRD